MLADCAGWGTLPRRGGSDRAPLARGWRDPLDFRQVSTSTTSAQAMRRWVDNMRAAQAREQQARRAAPLCASESWRRALALMSFAQKLGTPPADDDDERVQETWMRLRRVMGAG